MGRKFASMRNMLSFVAAATAVIPLGATPASTPPPETKDRLPPERMAELVRVPMALVLAGDLEGGERAFATMLENAAPEDRGDLLSAFGVTLYNEGSMLDDEEEDQDRLRRAAIPYLERAIPALAERFGENHPEVALALNSYADAALQLEPDDPPPSVAEALERADRIRMQTLGPRNPETISSLKQLARVRGLPSETGGDPARIEAAAALFRKAIELMVAAGIPDPDMLDSAWFGLAEMYAANDRVGQAISVVRAADRAASAQSRDPCGFSRWMLIARLAELGHPRAAAEIEKACGGTLLLPFPTD